MIEIENTPVMRPKKGKAPDGERRRTGLTEKLFDLEIDQSFVMEGVSYFAAYNCIRQAKIRKKPPRLVGEFLVIKLDGAVRIGRTA